MAPVAAEVGTDICGDAGVDIAHLPITASLPGRPSAAALLLHGVVEAGLVVKKTDKRRRMREEDLPQHFENHDASPGAPPRTVPSTDKGDKKKKDD